MSVLFSTYKLLSLIYKESAYANVALNAEGGEPIVRFIVKGVMQHEYELDYIIKSLTKTKPQAAVEIVLKQGVFCLLYANSMPDYAVVDESVKLMKKIGKGGAAGFVNAVLNKVAKRQYVLPQEGDKQSEAANLEVKFNKPLWLIKRVFAEYEQSVAESILLPPQEERLHVRVSESGKDFIADCAEKTPVGGYLSANSTELKKLFDEGAVTFQSASSMLAVQAIVLKSGDLVLDACAAPGGKAVYAAELVKSSGGKGIMDGENICKCEECGCENGCEDGGENSCEDGGERGSERACGMVTACDNYAHRVELIKAYARRMKTANLTAELCDATVPKSEFLQAFDAVLCDVPCSGLGVLRKKPDIALNRVETDIDSLANIQAAILKNSADYVKSGGTLVYSTCTVLRAENSEIVQAFLKSDSRFVLEKIEIELDKSIPLWDEVGEFNKTSIEKNAGEISLIPDRIFDGFYIAKLRKKAN